MTYFSFNTEVCRNGLVDSAHTSMLGVVHNLQTQTDLVGVALKDMFQVVSSVNWLNRVLKDEFAKQTGSHLKMQE